MKDRRAADWEELARREPYFAILTSEGLAGVEGSSVATPAYFETGEADVSSLLAAIASLLGHELRLTSALDFGCGAGRITLPLARRAGKVVACDIAPTMLAHARKNAEEAGLHNVTFIESNELEGLPAGSFDFVCSLLVLEHIPPKEGYVLIRTLLNVLAPGGVAALQITFERPGGDLRRFVRATRERSRFQHRTGLVHRVRSLQQTPVNGYQERVVQRTIAAAGTGLAGRFATNDGDAAGAVLIIERPRRLDL